MGQTIAQRQLKVLEKADKANRTLKALELVQSTQNAYWDALGELERITGLDLDSTLDYSRVFNIRLKESIAEGRYYAK
jgi:mRNA-degrading endonuclease HigB of HigAB toxin-antitoxin module